jgi:hypothetical protein
VAVFDRAVNAGIGARGSSDATCAELCWAYDRRVDAVLRAPLTSCVAWRGPHVMSSPRITVAVVRSCRVRQLKYYPEVVQASPTDKQAALYRERSRYSCKMSAQE